MSDYRLFEVVGIELEYMIVDRDTLDVRPIADQILTLAAGELTSDFTDGPITWSNELALHVIEMKTTEPVASLHGVAEQFQASLGRLNELAAQLNAVLLPTGMHPWMNPYDELRLWPHDSAAIYQAFNRIFDCRGHGWANLQSMHLNLPFQGDEEFGRLQAAIRLLLPLLPGLACSSPVADRRWTGFVDYRMEVYRRNSARIPEVAGAIVPEAVYTAAAYEREIFQPMYRAIAPYDPDGVLQRPFLNARGAIARFDRGSIEIRVIDTQEHPGADLAIADLVVAVLRDLVAERWTTWEAQRGMATETLAAGFREIVRSGEATLLDDPAWLAHLGLPPTPCHVGQVWRHLAATRTTAAIPESRASLERILEQGPLSRRILSHCGLACESSRPDGLGEKPAPAIDMACLRGVYQQLRDCLQQGRSLPSA